MESENSELNEEELRIVQEYLNGKSIRTLAFECPGYSRTKISNILKKYQNENPKYAEIIEAKKIKDKTHRNDADTIWTEKDTIEAYNQIKNGKTLVDVADTFGRTSTFLKREILSYIKDESEKKDFFKKIYINQSNEENIFFVASNEEKKKIIFDKLNFRRIQNNKNEYSKSVLERKYRYLKDYFLLTRNQKCDRKLSEEKFLEMLYHTPTLLASSISNKIIPAIENLDNNPEIGTEIATSIIEVDPIILCSSINRTNLQIRILSQNNLLNAFIKKPKNFRTSPELIYALIEFKKYREGKNSVHLSDIEDIFITKNKLLKKYGEIPENLIKTFDVKKFFGDDEYFNK